MVFINNCTGEGVHLPPLESCDECSAMADQLNALDDAVDDLQTTLASTNSTVATLQSALTGSQGDITALQTAVTGLTQRLAALERLIGNKQNTVIAMTDENNNETSVTVLAE